MAKPMTKTEWLNWLEKTWDEAQQAAWNAKEPAFECPRCGHCCQQREWVGLTDEEMKEAMEYWSDPARSTYGGAKMADGEYVNMVDTWRYIEAKLKEKNT